MSNCREIRFATLLVAMSIGSSAAVNIAAAQPAAQVPVARPFTPPRATAATKPMPTELADWRKTIVKIARPKKACFMATYPETVWHEVACKPSTHKLYPPRRENVAPVEIVGGVQGTEFIAGVSGHSFGAEGSFDQQTKVTGECNVPCDTNTGFCAANLTCNSPGAITNSYSLQINTQTFSGTSACKGAPAKGAWGECKGWQQFVYDPAIDGGGNIEYWLVPYGPPGTQCPGGWQGFSYSPTPTDPHPNVFCVYSVYPNEMWGSPAPSVLATDLPSIAIAGTAAGVQGRSEDELIIWVSNVAYSSPGNNIFPDLSTQWQQTEFNIFGAGGASQAVFASGSTVVVRVDVENGVATRPPSCALGSSFTGESNNLVLVGTAKSEVTPTPALTFWESFPGPSKPAASCPAAQPSTQCQNAVAAIAATQKQIADERARLQTSQCSGQAQYDCTQTLNRLGQALQAQLAQEREVCPNP
jgi:hypothetical protein